MYAWQRKYGGTELAWTAEPRTMPALREVVIAECLPPAVVATFVVHASCSVRIEGMSVSEAIAFVRGLQ